MAGRLIAGRGRGPSTLFFGGKGHVRMDRAVPYLIATHRSATKHVDHCRVHAVDEWANVLEDGSIRDQALNARYDIVVVVGQSNPTDEALCDMRALS
jgi:hypothetical protein